MITTGKGRLGPDIWPKILNQDTGSEDIILTILYNEAMKQKEINPQQQHLSSPIAKKACYASYINSN